MKQLANILKERQKKVMSQIAYDVEAGLPGGLRGFNHWRKLIDICEELHEVWLEAIKK